MRWILAVMLLLTPFVLWLVPTSASPRPSKPPASTVPVMRPERHDDTMIDRTMRGGRQIPTPTTRPEIPTPRPTSRRALPVTE